MCVCNNSTAHLLNGRSFQDGLRIFFPGKGPINKVQNKASVWAAGCKQKAKFASSFYFYCTSILNSEPLRHESHWRSWWTLTTVHKLMWPPPPPQWLSISVLASGRRFNDSLLKLCPCPVLAISPWSVHPFCHRRYDPSFRPCCHHLSLSLPTFLSLAPLFAQLHPFTHSNCCHERHQLSHPLSLGRRH